MGSVTQERRPKSGEPASGAGESVVPAGALLTGVRPENEAITSFPPLELRKRRLPESGGRFTYSLGGLLLLVTLISLHLALVVGLPCLGTPVALLAVPSYAWSSRILAKKRRNGHRVDLGDAIGSYVECFAWVVAILFSAVTAIALVIFALEILVEATGLLTEERQLPIALALLGIPALFLTHHFVQKRRRRAARLAALSANVMEDAT